MSKPLFRAKNASLLLDLLCILLLNYLAVRLGYWYTQGIWQDPFLYIPDTKFTDGHIAGTAIGILELDAGRILDFRAHEVGWPQGLAYKPLMWPAIAMGVYVGPVMALNYMWAFIPAFNALGGYLLGRAIGCGRIAASLCGVLLGWNTWVRVTMANGQIEQSTLGVIALILAAAIWAEHSPKWASIAMFGIVFLAGVSVPNVTLTALLILPLLAVGRVLQQWRKAPRWGFVMGVAVAASLAVNLYHSSNFDAQDMQFFMPRQGFDKSMQSAAELSGFFTPPAAEVSHNSVVHSAYVGRVWGLGAVAALLLAGKTGWLVVMCGVMMLVLALGPSVEMMGNSYVLPMAWLEYVVSILKKSGSYYRFTMGGVACFALASALALQAISRRSVVLAGGLLYLLSVQAVTEVNTVKAHPIPLDTRKALFHPELVSLRGGEGAVLDLPVLKGQGCDKNSLAYLNAYWVHQRPILHSMFPPVSYRSSEPRVSRLVRTLGKDNCADKILAAIQAMGVGAIVVHQTKKCPLQSAQLQCLRQALGPPVGEDRALLWWDGLLQRE